MDEFEKECKKWLDARTKHQEKQNQAMLNGFKLDAAMHGAIERIIWDIVYDLQSAHNYDVRNRKTAVCEPSHVKDYEFELGDRVYKSKGSYQAEGTVKARFRARDGSPRYVFEFDTPAGLVHIFNERQLASINGGVESLST